MERSLTCAGLAALLAACSFDTTGIAGRDAAPNLPDAVQVPDGSHDDGSNPPPDALVYPDAPLPPDASGPDAACAWSYLPIYFDPCASGNPEPNPALVLDEAGTYRYNTDTGTLTSPGDGAIATVDSTIGLARAMWVEGLAVEAPATLRVEGVRPLIIISTDNIAILGVIDASSYWDGGGPRAGAGSEPFGCPGSPPDPGQTCVQHGGSGGGGGAFGGNGGGGGEGGDTRDCEDGINIDGIPGGAGGIAIGAAPDILRGGCAGRDGAQNESGTGDRGRGGPGGGAVHLTARGTILVGGTIHAGGAGGTAGLDNRSGGGGGGSGGFVGVEAHTIMIQDSGVLAANGGGGGGGCDNSAAEPGDDGQPSDDAAEGGDEQNAGGAGGEGGHRDVPAGQPGGLGIRGGGGGGGGVGFIIFRSPSAPTIDASAIVSPAFVLQ